MRLRLLFEGNKIRLFECVERGMVDRFISFLKKSFKEGDEEVFNRLFKAKRVKNYVASFYLGRDFDKGFLGRELGITFSTGDVETFTTFYNGVLNARRKNVDYLEIDGHRFSLKKFSLLPLRKISSCSVVFKTIGCVVLTDPEKSSKRFEEWYVTPCDGLDRFVDVLNKRLAQRYLWLRGKPLLSRVNFEPLSGDSVREVRLRHHEGYVKCFKGRFRLSGDPEVLQFVYDYGLGVKTGQGFGLLEVVN